MISDKVLKTAEIACWCIGLAMVGLYFAMRADGEIERQAAISTFMAEAAIPRQVSRPVYRTREPDTLTYAEPDKTHWSKGRIHAYESVQATAGKRDRMPVAVLRIRRIGLEVPVYAAETVRNMNRGAVLIEGTAPPDTGGNTAIAAHRDGYFRLLKKVVPGDVVTVQTLYRMQRYTVTMLEVVKPTDVSVLRQTNEPVVTLVTCYPFYFVGPAPRRYIVTAVALESAARGKESPVPAAPIRATPKHRETAVDGHTFASLVSGFGNGRQDVFAVPPGFHALQFRFLTRGPARNPQPVPDRRVR